MSKSKGGREVRKPKQPKAAKPTETPAPITTKKSK